MVGSIKSLCKNAAINGEFIRRSSPAVDVLLGLCCSLRTKVELSVKGMYSGNSHYLVLPFTKHLAYNRETAKTAMTSDRTVA